GRERGHALRIEVKETDPFAVHVVREDHGVAVGTEGRDTARAVQLPIRAAVESINVRPRRRQAEEPSQHQHRPQPCDLSVRCLSHGCYPPPRILGMMVSLPDAANGAPASPETGADQEWTGALRLGRKALRCNSRAAKAHKKSPDRRKNPHHCPPERGMMGLS